MGTTQSSSSLTEVTERAAERVGQISVVGRYHRLPARLEDDYTLEKKALGAGYSGSVLLARGKKREGKFAVKAFKLHGVGKEKKQELASEAEIILSMDHPHVVRLYDVYESEDRLSLVMECMDGGELFDRVHERKVFSEKDACKTSWMMLLAVNYIHSWGVVHRDLKLENFLYEKKDNDFLKLIDFGFSKIWKKNTKMELSCGTLSYAAPEVLGKSYTSQCDLWSLGVIVFILLVGYMPFAGSDERKQISLITSGNYSVKKERWAKVSTRAYDFVQKLLVVDPDRRLTAPQALEHPWIQGRDSVPEDHIDQAIVDSLVEFARTQKFRRSCMEMMAWSLNAEERSQVREAFLELDKSRSGTVTLSELKRVLEDNFHVPEDETLAVFQALGESDADEIHYSEFLAAMMTSRIELHDDLLKDAFRRFDTDNSGYINKEDLMRVLGSEQEVSEVMGEVDVNKDGKISYDEFIGYLKDGQVKDTALEAVERAISREIITSPGRGQGRLRKRERLKSFFNNLFG